MIDRIVRPTEAETLTGYCDVHLRRLEARGEFPQRFRCRQTVKVNERHVSLRAADFARQQLQQQRLARA